jgi:hypothetical protein
MKKSGPAATVRLDPGVSPGQQISIDIAKVKE